MGRRDEEERINIILVSCQRQGGHWDFTAGQNYCHFWFLLLLSTEGKLWSYCVGALLISSCFFILLFAAAAFALSLSLPFHNLFCYSMLSFDCPPFRFSMFLIPPICFFHDSHDVNLTLGVILDYQSQHSVTTKIIISFFHSASTV